MRALQCRSGRVTLRKDIPEPAVKTGTGTGTEEVVLRVLLAGICETDLQLVRGYMNFQGTLGHEFVGVTPNGRRYTSEINYACGECPVCRSDLGRHCPYRSVLGILNRDGAMADFVAVPVKYLHEIPDGLDDEEAVFIEPLAAAYRILEQVSWSPGQTVAVLGDGKLGLLCTWVVRNTGAVTWLVGKHADKLALAGEGVLTRTREEVATGAHHHACDVVIDCTGSPDGLVTALHLVRPCGTIVLKTTVAGNHNLSLAPLVIDEIRIVGSRCGPFPRALTALVRREVNVRPLIEAVYPLDDAENAFQAAARPGARKILLRP